MALNPNSSDTGGVTNADLNTSFLESSVQQNPTMSYGFSQDLQAEELPAYGTKSLFNEYAVFRFQAAGGDHNKLLDKAGQPSTTDFKSKQPTASNIIAWSQETPGEYAPFGSTPYSYSDFLYCTYHTKIPNNYLVTLRRFPFPMMDNLMTVDGKSIPPVAQAVTWFGEETGNPLKEILRFSFGQNWKEIEASVQEVVGNEKGFDDGLIAEAPGASGLKNILGFLNPKQYSGQSQSESDYAQKVYGSDGPYANKVYGPVNVISKTYARDRGLRFESDIKLNFHYSLRSIGNINPKMAMLDLMSNILTMTYNNAKFWGGAIRYFPQYPNVKFFGDQSKFYNGDVDGYINSMIKSFGSLADTFMKTFEKLLADPVAALKELATGGAKMLMGNKAAKSRPDILAMRSLLTGEPVGEWHLVVGNPMNPIAMIGNLICTDVEFEFGEELGQDDFPSDLKVTVSLKHGKPRDKGDIESMFNLGNGRMYFGIKDSVFSSAHNSTVDTSGQKGSKDSAGKTTSASNNLTQTSDESAANVRHGNANNVRSMWGNRFTNAEFNITNAWAGSTKVAPTQKPSSSQPATKTS